MFNCFRAQKKDNPADHDEADVREMREKLQRLMEFAKSLRRYTSDVTTALEALMKAQVAFDEKGVPQAEAIGWKRRGPLVDSLSTAFGDARRLVNEAANIANGSLESHVAAFEGCMKDLDISDKAYVNLKHYEEKVRVMEEKEAARAARKEQTAGKTEEKLVRNQDKKHAAEDSRATSSARAKESLIAVMKRTDPMISLAEKLFIGVGEGFHAAAKSLPPESERANWTERLVNERSETNPFSPDASTQSPFKDSALPAPSPQPESMHSLAAEDTPGEISSEEKLKDARRVADSPRAEIQGLSPVAKDAEAKLVPASTFEAKDESGMTEELLNDGGRSEGLTLKKVKSEKKDKKGKITKKGTDKTVKSDGETATETAAEISPSEPKMAEEATAETVAATSPSEADATPPTALSSPDAEKAPSCCSDTEGKEDKVEDPSVHKVFSGVPELAAGHGVELDSPKSRKTRKTNVAADKE